MNIYRMFIFQAILYFQKINTNGFCHDLSKRLRILQANIAR